MPRVHTGRSYRVGHKSCKPTNSNCLQDVYNEVTIEQISRMKNMIHRINRELISTLKVSIFANWGNFSKMNTRTT